MRLSEFLDGESPIQGAVFEHLVTLSGHLRWLRNQIGDDATYFVRRSPAACSPAHAGGRAQRERYSSAPFAAGRRDRRVPWVVPFDASLGGLTMAESSALSVYLRERRMAAGLARNELAVRAQMAPLLISQIEAGTLVPNPPMLQRLFDSLDVPQWYRKHILVLGLPSVESGPPPTAPSAEDLADLSSLTHPACLQRFPTMDVLAANTDYQRLFPGLGTGVNMLQWMFLNETAKEIFVDWTTEAQLLVHAFRMLSPLAPSHRVTAIAEACGRAPDWDEIWATDVRPQDIARRHIRLRERGTNTERRMLLRVYDPAFPTRPWWLYRLIPTR